MKYTEQIGNLFDLDPAEYTYVQCISADLAMGTGIATQFNKHFNTKKNMKAKAPNGYLDRWDNGELGFCIYEHPVMNLITKRNYWNKPNYLTLINALDELRKRIVAADIRKLAMPQIGCGLDKLEWTQVRRCIDEAFGDLDVEIIVCGLKHTRDFPNPEYSQDTDVQLEGETYDRT